MKIGITYDLRSRYLEEGYSDEATAEFDKIETIEAIERTLRLLGHETDRIGNAQDLVQALADDRRWELVFNIAEGMHGLGRESLIPSLLDAYAIPCVFSDPMVMALTLHKGMAKRVIRDAGLPTADFLVVERLEDLDGFSGFGERMFAKPVAEGTSKGVSELSVISSTAQLRTVCEKLLKRYNQPVLVEEFLPGREVTIGIVGREASATALGVMEINYLTEGPEIYCYETKEEYETRVRYRPVSDGLYFEAVDLALQAYRTLGLRDAGRVDLRQDASGRLNFIEVNPLPGLNPVHSDLPILSRMHGITFEKLMGMILDAALQRLAPWHLSCVPSQQNLLNSLTMVA